MSLPSLAALDAKIDVTGMKIYFKALKATVPLLRTPSRHLGIRVDEFGEGEPREENLNLRSDREDLHVYLAECSYLVKEDYGSFDHEELQLEDLRDDDTTVAVSLLARGVRRGDKLCEFTKRRADELEKSRRQVEARDRMTWAALRRTYTLAEKFATKGFKTTVFV